MLYGYFAFLITCRIKKKQAFPIITEGFFLLLTVDEQKIKVTYVCFDIRVGSPVQ